MARDIIVQKLPSDIKLYLRTYEVVQKITP
jgi:hypothetical protein